MPSDRRRQTRPRRTLLTQAELDGLLRDGIPIVHCDLSCLSLQGTPYDLRGADFRDCDFSDVTLRGVDLSGAQLSDCVFARAELHGACLTGANLRGADLTRVYGLTQDQLRGTLLAGAKLSADLFKFEGLDRVRDLVHRGERTLYILLLACTSVGVICFATGDEQLFQSTTALTLPGLDLPVPLTAFYQLVPLLLLGFFFSLSLTLRRLWSELADLPAEFHNDRWLHDQAASSTPNFVSVVAPYLRTADPKLRPTWTDRVLIVGTVWCATPLVLWVTIQSYLPRHAWPLTMFHFISLAVAVVASILFYRNMHGVLASTFGHVVAPAPSLAAHPEESDRPAPRPHGPGRLKLKITRDLLSLGGMRGGVTANEAITGDREPREPAPEPEPRPLRATSGHRWPQVRWGVFTSMLAAGALLAIVFLAIDAREAMDRAGCIPLAERSAEVRPEGIDRYLLGRRCTSRAADLGNASLANLQLPGGNLRRAFMRSVTLTGANLEDADLAYANLISARLAGANLKDAHLDSAVLWEANLTGARLKEAEMRGADLRGALLALAQVQGVDFRNADLRGVEWGGAIVCGAKLDSLSRVDWPKLREARGSRRIVVSPPRASGLAHARDSMKAFRGDSIPHYLDEADGDAYFRWRDAWLRVRALDAHTPAVESVIAYRPLRDFVDGLDVSAGESRQRQQIQILAYLDDSLQARGADTTVVYTDSLHSMLTDFRKKIRDKARNHCYDASRDGVPPGSPFVIRRRPAR